MPDRAPETGLPQSLRGYLWEYDAAHLMPDADAPTIMLRLMESGDQDAIGWLRGYYGDAALASFLRRRRGRGLSLKRLRYWGLVLGIEAGTVTAWITALRADPWYNRVAR
jgi:hypothetical protein